MARCRPFALFALLSVLLTAGCQSLIGLEDRVFAARDAGAVNGDGDGDGDDNTDEEDAGGVEDAGTGPSPACVAYCDRVMDRCTGQYAVYPSIEVCNEVCARLPAGDSDDPSGNTVACRSEIARFITEPASDCPAAGPGGAGRCGDNCQSYCILMDQVCEDFRAPSVEECIADCAALRDRDNDSSLGVSDSRYSAETSSARDHDGDTVQCRLFHAAVASAPFGAEAHCWHAALAPRPLEGSGAANPCSRDVDQVEPRCTDYCDHVQVACTGDQAVYESEEQCLAACAAMPLGDVADSGGQNTVGCRNAHSYNALDGDAVLHCTHAGPSGATVCGNDCESFCTQLQDACSDGYTAQFGTGDAAATACADACVPLLDGESVLKYSLATVDEEDTPALACRLRAVVRAQVDASDATLCDQALGLQECE